MGVGNVALPLIRLKDAHLMIEFLECLCDGGLVPGDERTDESRAAAPANRQHAIVYVGPWPDAEQLEDAATWSDQPAQRSVLAGEGLAGAVLIGPLLTNVHPEAIVSRCRLPRPSAVVRMSWGERGC